MVGTFDCLSDSENDDRVNPLGMICINNFDTDSASPVLDSIFFSDVPRLLQPTGINVASSEIGASEEEFTKSLKSRKRGVKMSELHSTYNLFRLECDLRF